MRKSVLAVCMVFALLMVSSCGANKDSCAVAASSFETEIAIPNSTAPPETAMQTDIPGSAESTLPAYDTEPEASAVSAAEPATEASSIAESDSAAQAEDTPEDRTLSLSIDGQAVSVVWEENESVEALRELAAIEPLVIQMSMYSDFEQVGSIGQSLPRNDVQTVTEAGDVVLYSGDQIVVFYGSNTWAYTRLGRIMDKTASEMAELLGNGDVTITIRYM